MTIRCTSGRNEIMAKKGKYVFDRDRLVFRKDRRKAGGFFKTVGSYLLLSVSFTVVVYLLFSLLFNTNEESLLIEQNRAYEEQLPLLQEKAELIDREIAYLTACDSTIYRLIFRSDAPKVDVMSSFSFSGGIDSIPDTKMVEYSASKLRVLESKSSSVEKNLVEVMQMLARRDSLDLPPMAAPVRGFSTAQVGASIGERINPYYKVPVFHGGMDIISDADVPVVAAGDGVVTSVTRSMKGQGNVVTISHKGGYETRYAHLSSIAVSKGMNVSAGRRIGGVGVSGNAYAPHLHYEVLKDGKTVNPANYMFASFDVPEYVDILVMSSVTKQSMD